MVASKEWFEYHLTPSGWIEGSEKLDFGHGTERPCPKDCVLTVRITEILPALGAEAYCTLDIYPSNSSNIYALLQKYGENPHGSLKRFAEWEHFMS